MPTDVAWQKGTLNALAVCIANHWIADSDIEARLLPHELLNKSTDMVYCVLQAVLAISCCVHRCCNLAVECRMSSLLVVRRLELIKEERHWLTRPLQAGPYKWIDYHLQIAYPVPYSRTPALKS